MYCQKANNFERFSHTNKGLSHSLITTYYAFPIFESCIIKIGNALFYDNECCS